jgi:hypothetical protein
LCFIHEVVDRVQEHVSRSGTSREKRNPLPIVVFGVQDEVDRHNSCTNGNHGQNQVNEQHKSVNVIKLVRPKCGENKVHFYENGPKWQYP